MGLLLAISFPQVTFAQTSSVVSPQEQPKTLQELLGQATPPFSLRATTPILIVDPAHTPYTVQEPLLVGRSLEALLPSFDRKIFSVGTLRCVAPIKMEIVSGVPRQRPNLYDGLPRDEKVLYLFSTLSEMQWKQIANSGLGINDLEREQRAVFLSLLPQPFQVTQWRLDKEGRLSTRQATDTLSEEQRQQVRLKLSRFVNIEVPHNQTGISSSFSTLNTPGKPEGIAFVREDQAEREQSDLYGVTLRQSVRNTTKPSDLDYNSSALSSTLSLDGLHTIEEVLERVRTTTRLAFFADPQLGRLPVQVLGPSTQPVSAGDVLEAVALTVTGTFRRVGDSFLLTDDLAGIGTRYLRLANWQAEVKAEVKKRTQEWSDKIRRSSHTRYATFSEGDPYAPTPRLVTEIKEREGKIGKEAEFQTSALPPGFRKYLEFLEQRHRQDRELRFDTVRLRLLLGYGFVLGDGTVLGPEKMLGDLETVKGREAISPSVSPLPPPTVTATSLPANRKCLLFLSVSDRQTAVEAVKAARQLGFTEVVLHTEAVEVLKAALEESKTGGPLISVAVAPFSASSSVGTVAVEESKVDRNLLGETAEEIVTYRRKSQRWKNYLDDVADTVLPKPDLERLYGVPSAIAPVTPFITECWNRLAALAASSGLAGVYLYDSQPDGYAGQRPFGNMTGFSDDVPLAEMGGLGYSPALRSAFLSKNGIDPVDLIPPGMDIRTNLQLIFFPDRERFTEALWKRWDIFRAEANRTALSDLFRSLRARNPLLPLFIETRPLSNNAGSPGKLLTAYVSWKEADFLPQADISDFTSLTKNGRESNSKFLMPHHFFNPHDPTETAALYRQWQTAVQAANTSDQDFDFALDLSALNASRAIDLLKIWIKPGIRVTIQVLDR